MTKLFSSIGRFIACSRKCSTQRGDYQEGGKLDYNLIVKTFLQKRPTLQIEASGIESHNKDEGAPLYGVRRADGTIFTPIVVL
jgi:hypothetical protein